MATKKQSPLQRAYNNLKKVKSRYCQGKVTKTAVGNAAKKYVKMAVSKGQTKVEAERKANRVKKAGCKMSSSVAGTRKRKTTRRKTKK